MKESKLVIDNRIQSSIELGLKVLQFATQYNLRKAYYRNCPLNFYSGSGEKSSIIKKSQRQSPYDQIGDLFTQLNAQLQEQPKKQVRKSFVHPLTSSIKPKSSEHDFKKQNRPSSKHQKSNPSILDESNNSSSESSVANADQCSDYHSDASKNKLVSIREESEKDPDTPKKIKQKSSFSKVASKSKQKKQQHEKSSNNISNLSQKSKKNKPKIQIVKKTQQKGSQMPVKQHQTSSFNHLSPNSQIINQSAITQLVENSKTSKRDLDKAISQIQVSNIRQSQRDSFTVDQVQVQLLKQLSSSFQAGQNLKTLMKLQNYEIKQKFLQMRLNSRFQNAFKYSRNLIDDLSWDSLRLPGMTCAFKRPGYALMTQ